ncbi:MAG: ECF transporter S component [Clostridia bacterium]|nr:ECF transporter S component [Clostridia bacterium]
MTDKTIHPKIRGSVRSLTFSALFLAIALLLPFVTGQIPQIGALLSPMHLPAFLAGYLCGPFWGALVGLAAPLLRHVLFGMPPLMTAIPMAIELAAYAVLAGVLYRVLPKKTGFLYLSLALSMIGGRILYAAVKMTMLGLGGEAFTPWLVLLDTVTGTWAGILIQFVLVPPLVLAAERFFVRGK